jgi:2-dehydro-3-deoxyphosphogluconate aldolase/(4S)-4-hydroxy-2-oxoglutarate aldolase
MKRKTESLLAVLGGQPVVPVLLIDDLKDAVPLARALAKGGLPAVEITLRTSAALDAIRLVAADVPEAIVGAGTVLNARQYAQAVDAGARFLVSPGTTTPSEVMALSEEGYSLMKFFPAEQAGGAPFLKALASPLAGISFCPTGGISPANAKEYLSLPNVICIGGSWVAPKDLVRSGNWDAITELAAEAAKLA